MRHTKRNLRIFVSAAAALLPLTTGAGPASAQQCDGVAAAPGATAGDDVLYGTPGPDYMVGLGGDDDLYGGGGNDHICGGSGADVIDGETGDDHIFGDSGNDDLRGGADTYVPPETDADTLVGGSGDDEMNGGAKHDIFDGGTGTDTCYTETDDAVGPTNPLNCP